MTTPDRLTEIKARVEAFSKNDDPYRTAAWALDDLEFALGVIDDQDKQIESLQNKWATRPVTDQLQIERDRLRAEWRFLRELVAEREGHGGDIPVWLALEWIDSSIARAALEENK